MSEEHGALNDVVTAQFGEQAKSIETAFGEQEAAEAVSSTEEAEPAAEPKEDEFAKKFAALSRKEKEIRDRDNEYRIKEQEYNEKMARYEELMAEIEASKTPEPEPELPLEYRLKKDPLGTLQKMGYDYNTLAELALNDGKLPQEMQMKLMREELENDYKKRFETLEQKLTEKEKMEEQSKYENTINNFKAEIEDFVSKDSEAYELIQANNATNLVYEVIEEHYKETNRVLDISDAAKAVEEYLEEEAQKLFKLKKFSKFQERTTETSKPETRQESITLSNDHSAMSQNQSEPKLSREAEIAQLAKTIKFME